MTLHDRVQCSLPFDSLWVEFMGVECPACGSPKRPNMGFCGDCYFSLPKSFQARLWRKFGAGYEEAHQAAFRVLRARLLVAREKAREVRP